MESTSSAPTSPGGKQAQRLGHRPMLTTWDAAVIVLSLIWTLVNRFAFSHRLNVASEPHPWEVENVESEAAPAS